MCLNPDSPNLTNYWQDGQLKANKASVDSYLADRNKNYQALSTEWTTCKNAVLKMMDDKADPIKCMMT